MCVNNIQSQDTRTAERFPVFPLNLASFWWEFISTETFGLWSITTASKLSFILLSSSIWNRTKLHCCISTYEWPLCEEGSVRICLMTQCSGSRVHNCLHVSALCCVLRHIFLWPLSIYLKSHVLWFSILIYCVSTAMSSTCKPGTT